MAEYDIAGFLDSISVSSKSSMSELSRHLQQLIRERTSKESEIVHDRILKSGFKGFPQLKRTPKSLTKLMVRVKELAKERGTLEYVRNPTVIVTERQVVYAIQSREVSFQVPIPDSERSPKIVKFIEDLALESDLWYINSRVGVLDAIRDCIFRIKTYKKDVKISNMDDLVGLVMDEIKNQKPVDYR